MIKKRYSIFIILLIGTILFIIVHGLIYFNAGSNINDQANIFNTNTKAQIENVNFKLKKVNKISTWGINTQNTPIVNVYTTNSLGNKTPKSFIKHNDSLFNNDYTLSVLINSQDGTYHFIENKDTNKYISKHDLKELTNKYSLHDSTNYDKITQLMLRDVQNVYAQKK